MKNIYILISLFLLGATLKAQKANLFTIPNQSVAFIRMPARETMIDVDAVFFNPANLPSLGSGFQINLNNQILNQKSIVTSDYSLYNTHPKEYPGNVKSFIFPSVYINWNVDKASFHGGFLIIGGAGGVDYANLPISDRGVADVPAAITNSNFLFSPSLTELDAQIKDTSGIDPQYSNISNYRYDFKNKGLAFSPGFQVGAAYQLNEYFSFSLDLRYMQQTFSSEGEVSNIQILPNTADPNLNEWIAAGDYLREIALRVNDSGYNFVAGIYDELSADRLINIRQKGSGVTFIPSVLIKPTPKLFIALKYEHRTKVVLKTKVRNGKDGGIQNGRPIFINGEEIRSDIPGFISYGLGYQFNDKWRLNFGGRYMFIKSANFDGREQYIDKNYYELELAAEYKMFKKFLISGGYTYNKAGVNQNYHNEVDFWIPGHSFCFGGRVDFNKNISVDLSGMFTKNVGTKYTYIDHLYANGESLAGKPDNYDNTYTLDFKKHSFIIGVGLTIKINNDKENINTLDKSPNSDKPYNFRG